MRSGMVLVLLVGLAAASGHAAAEKPEAGVLVVIDNSGKEHKLKDWKFVAGTRRLSWLAQPEKEDGGKPAKTPAGPEALEFSAGKSPPLKKRVLTLVPLESVRAIEYDNDKETVTLRLAGSADADEVLHGVTGYVGVNVVAVEAPADLGGLGQATVKFQGGVKRGVRSIRFPSPRPLTAVGAGRAAEVIGTAKGKEVHRAVGLQPLYLFPDGSLRTVPTLLFQKTVKIDLDNVQKMSQVGNGNAAVLVFDVTLKDGQQNPLVLLERLELAKNRAAVLQGLVGRVEAGYKLFPMQVLAELRFEGKAETPK